MGFALHNLQKPPEKCYDAGPGKIDYSKIIFRPAGNVFMNGKPAGTFTVIPPKPYTCAVKTKQATAPSAKSIMSAGSVFAGGCPLNTSEDLGYTDHLRLQYGTPRTLPPSHACTGGGLGNTTKGVPPAHQNYLDTIKNHDGDWDWDRCDKQGIDLYSTGENYYSTPTNQIPTQSYYGMLDDPSKNQFTCQKSPNVFGMN
tara:strand:- start:293 stop:889 length:597 start_codon:yes stop_codon:yes gene_type:complete